MLVCVSVKSNILNNSQKSIFLAEIFWRWQWRIFQQFEVFSEQTSRWTGYKKCCPYFQGPAVSNANGSAPPSGAPSSGGGLDKEKEIRKLQKKLDDIAKLKAKKAAGENLEVNQVQKIDKEAELVAEMKKLKAWNFFSINPHLYLKLSGTFGKIITYFDFRGVSSQKQF